MDPEQAPNLAQVQRIVSSSLFRSSQVHRNLLTYLSQKALAGEAGNLKEYTVGVDLFGKPDSYDPRQESSVRVHVGRLRQKLTEYYRTEGVTDPIVIDLPKGGFSLKFASRPDASAEAVPQPRGWTMTPRDIALVATLIVAMAAAAGYLVRRSSPAATGAPVADADPLTPDLQALWAPLFASDRPLMVTLATGASNATDTGTANAGFLLGQFLGQRKHNAFPIKAAELSIGELTMADVIVVGPPGGRPRLQGVPAVDAAFVLTPEGVKNVRPAAGEPAFLPETANESHAMISCLPGLNGNGSIVYFEGNQGAAVVGAVQAMTDPDLAGQLVTALKKANVTLPRYYQVVLKVKAADDTPVDIAYVWLRALTMAKTSAG